MRTNSTCRWMAGGRWDDLRSSDNGPTGYVVEYEPEPTRDPPTITGYAATDPRGATIASAPPGAPLLITGANLATAALFCLRAFPLPAVVATWNSTEIPRPRSNRSHLSVPRPGDGDHGPAVGDRQRVYDHRACARGG